MSQHYALGQEVYFRLTDKEMPKEGKLVSVGDAFTVKLENGDVVTAPSNATSDLLVVFSLEISVRNQNSQNRDL